MAQPGIREALYLGGVTLTRGPSSVVPTWLKAQTRDRIKKLHVSSGGANTGIAEVLEAVIDDSGRSANVKMHMFGEFIVPIKGERGMTEVQATQELFCDDELVLNSAGDIQIKSSTCKIHARMGVPGQKIPMPVKDTP